MNRLSAIALFALALVLPLFLPLATWAESPTTAPSKAAAPSKKILFVVASRDFYYQEYNDPRSVLIAAGFEPVVASIRDQCIPHPNTGQGSASGVIKTDILLADVNPDDYVAIVFPGGWGASMYQPGFNVRYDKGEYNASSEVKNRVNELVTQFVRSGKYVGGICHGVTVLAYCKVDGKSLITGKKISGPAIGGPGFTANGKHTGDLELHAKWHIEQNGGRFVPLNSVGNASASEDDVTVDGKIISAQDNTSARQFGVVLSNLLQKK